MFCRFLINILVSQVGNVVYVGPGRKMQDGRTYYLSRLCEIWIVKVPR